MLGGAGAVAGLAGCAPKVEAAEGGSEEDKARAAFEAAAEPILPADVPATWDEEREIVVVGTGAAGVNAGIRLAQAGYDVLMLERRSHTGGNSQHSSVFSNLGGHKQAEAKQWAYPEYPYDVDKIVEFVMDCQQISC